MTFRKRASFLRKENGLFISTVLATQTSNSSGSSEESNDKENDSVNKFALTMLSKLEDEFNHDDASPETFEKCPKKKHGVIAGLLRITVAAPFECAGSFEHEHHQARRTRRYFEHSRSRARFKSSIRFTFRKMKTQGSRHKS